MADETETKPKRKKPPALSREQKMERLAIAEELIATLQNRRLVIEALKRRLNVSAHVAQTVVEQVYALWALEESGTDRSLRRQNLRESASLVFRKAMTRRVVVHRADGAPALDAKGDLIRREAPDLKSAARALEILAKLDGLLVDRIEMDNGLAGLAAQVDAEASAPTHH